MGKALYEAYPCAREVFARAGEVYKNVTGNDATLEDMLADGVGLFVELGPGRVLSGLIKRVSRTAKLVNTEAPDGVK